MRFDSKVYAGQCACGRAHSLETKFCVIESGALKSIKKWMDEYKINGFTVAVYDENTYLATRDRHPNVDFEVILPADHLHANEHGVDLLLARLPIEAQVLIAIGSGTVHDITRYCAYQKKIVFVSCPTAASVDGFCSSVAAMTWNGCKKTLTAVAPTIVVADLDVICNAPIRLAKSGFGDMIGKFIALFDWNVGRILKNEYYCEKISNMTLSAAKSSVEAMDGILRGETSAYETLTYGLLLSGLAMQMIGNSRPASGAEHHISHLIEMEPAGLGIHSEALHGEKVGVGTLLVLKRYQKLLSLENPKFSDYIPFSAAEIKTVFGNEKMEEMVRENESDSAGGIDADILSEHFAMILQNIKQLPPVEQMKELFQKGEIISDLNRIGVTEDLEDSLLKFAPMVRNRLTLLRLLSRNTIR